MKSLEILYNLDYQTPQYIGGEAQVHKSIVSEGCEVYGEVLNSVLYPGVTVEQGAIIRDSIVMANTVVKKGSVLDRCIIAENCSISENVKIGEGENIPNNHKPNIYNTGISVIGENTSIPSDIWIGKNCVVYGDTTQAQYENGRLESGNSLIVEGVEL